jgi:outer membrane protein OmpA-like peptidoglycan-associated protein
MTTMSMTTMSIKRLSRIIRRSGGVLLAGLLIGCAAADSDGDSTIASSAPRLVSSTPEQSDTSPTIAATSSVLPGSTEFPAGADTSAPNPTEALVESVPSLAAPLGPLDDLDEDGSADELCGSADLGGDLVIQPLCDTSLAPAPEDGVYPTVGSLLLLPTPSRWEDLVDVDATVRVAKAIDGRQLVIYVLGSDALFDNGSATIRSTAQPPLAAIVASIMARFASAPVDVRGAADSVGSFESNQILSDRRAQSVVDQLVALGIDPSRVRSRGLGSSVPVAEELNPDGSVSDIGRQVNRRVEIVVG